MDATFSFNRIKQLGIRYFVENWKKDILMGLILMAFTLMYSNTFNSSNGLMMFYMLFVLFYASATLGSGTKSLENTMFYFLIPASTLEKLINKALITHLFYTIYFTLFVVVGILIKGVFIVFFVKNLEYDTLGLLQHFFGFVYRNYLLIVSMQAVIMFGTIYFKEHVLLKTLLTVLGFFFLLGLIAMIVFFSSVDITNMFTVAQVAITSKLGRMLKYLPLTLNIVVILYFWILSYFRLRETEV